MASTLVRELIDSGIHFGHRSSRWNPKMKPYIFDKRNLIHIVDIRETLKGLMRAKKYVSGIIARGQDVLFVGTKRQARDAVKTNSERCGMHYVIERWLGGTLTNFRTIRSRLQRLEELEAIVAGPTWETGYSKKMQSTLTRELKKIRRNLDGVRKMTRLPGALIVIDVKKEINAVREAKALGIPTICLIDTDSDPDFASIAIPGNDDAIRAIELVVRNLADAVEEGKRARVQSADDGEAGRDGSTGDGPGGPPRGRGRLRRGSRSEEAESPPVSGFEPTSEIPAAALAGSATGATATPPSA